MKCLILTQSQYDNLLALQEGQHQLAPLALTNGNYFLMEDVLTEMPEGIYKDKLKDVNYTVQSFESIQDLLFVAEEDDII